MELRNELQTYIKAYQRKKMMFIVPAAATMIIAILVAFMLPSIYRSTAIILIETPDIPEDLVRSTVTGLIEERLQGLNQVVLNRSQLLEIMDRFDLYPDKRITSSTSELVNNMRGDIGVEMIQTEINDTEFARSGMATYAFSISYENKDPEKALQVANMLVSLYLEKNIETREGKARSTFNYLEARIVEIEAQMDDVSEQVSIYKEQHRYTLPELMDVTYKNLEKLETNLAFKEDQVEKKIQQIRYWTSRQSATPKFIIVRTTGGQRLITPEEELDRMRRDYVSLLATRSEDHPDAVNLKKEITALEEQIKHRQDLKDYQDDLEARENELADAQEKFSSHHPDVSRLSREVARLQEDIRTLEERYSIISKKQDKEINPLWVHATTELDSHKIELTPLQMDVQKLSAHKLELQRRIDEGPQVELEYNSMLHQLEVLKAEHDDLLTRTLSAKESKGLEESGLGERFTLIDPPVREEKPAKPNRPLLLALGMILAITVGIGTGTLAEFADRSVHNADQLSGMTGLPVLTVIPYIHTRTERLSLKKKKGARTAIMVGAVILGIMVFHMVVAPLDMLFFKIVSKLQGLF